MVDRVTMHESGRKFDRHPAGTFTAVCVDVVDLGTNVETFQGADPKLKQKVLLVFATGEIGDETQEPVYANAEYTLSGHPKAGLRKMLEAWRGRPYTDTELRGGFQLEKLVGMACTVSVAHNTSTNGRVYAKVTGVAPVMKGATPPDHASYVRDDYWEVRKTNYARAVEEYYRTLHGGAPLPTVPKNLQPKAPPVAKAAAPAGPPKDLATLRDELEAASEQDDDLPF
jgi:hypothetical protein